MVRTQLKFVACGPFGIICCMLMYVYYLPAMGYNFNLHISLGRRGNGTDRSMSVNITTPETLKNITNLSTSPSDHVKRCRMEERLDVLNSHCKKMYPRGTHLPKSLKRLRALVKHLVVDETNKVIACLHAKVASSTWKRILAYNSDPDLKKSSESKGLIGIHSLNHEAYTYKDIVHRLKTFFKFMVVRHPFDRLESMYNNKITMRRRNPVNEKLFLHAKPPQHIHSYKTLYPNRYYFQDIVKLMEDGYWNSHWQGPYHLNCHPCHINYDYIIKLETYDDDAAFVIHNRLQGKGLNVTLKSDRIGTVHEGRGDGRYLSSYRNITQSQMDFLFHRLNVDLRMFGYEFARKTLKAKCRNWHTGNGKSDCC